MNRWQAGAKTAHRCARPLLRTMRTQGWPPLTEMTDTQRELLEADVLKNTRGAVSWSKCLLGWVQDLRLYTKAITGSTADGAAAQDAGSRERCPDHPSRYRRGCVDCALAVPA
jgi:hypothetical protein